MIVDLLKDAVAHWENIPWVVNKANRFNDLPGDIRQGLAAFGAALRRLQGELEGSALDAAEYEQKSAEFSKTRANLEQQIRILQAEVQRLQLQASLTGQREEQAQERLRDVESQVTAQLYSAEQLAKLEVEVRQLQRINETLMARNSELEQLLEREKQGGMTR